MLLQSLLRVAAAALAGWALAVMPVQAADAPAPAPVAAPASAPEAGLDSRVQDL